MEGELHTLRSDIMRLLAEALDSDARHAAEQERRDQLHIAETDRRDELHHAEMVRRADRHEHELELIRTALETRDTIGQAKGVIMASLGCSAGEAFVLIRRQSQHENRPLVEVAAEIVNRASRHHRLATEAALEPGTTAVSRGQRDGGARHRRGTQSQGEGSD